jgi:hypothetical protein
MHNLTPGIKDLGFQELVFEKVTPYHLGSLFEARGMVKLEGEK